MSMSRKIKDFGGCWQDLKPLGLIVASAKTSRSKEVPGAFEVIALYIYIHNMFCTA